VPARVSPVERVRAEIDQLFADPTRGLADVLEDVARLGARLLLQTALEAEVTAFLVESATSAIPMPAQVIATATSP
jgi:putative transposase